MKIFLYESLTAHWQLIIPKYFTHFLLPRHCHRMIFLKKYFPYMHELYNRLPTMPLMYAEKTKIIEIVKCLYTWRLLLMLLLTKKFTKLNIV